MSRVDLSALLWAFAAIWLLSVPLRWIAAAILSIVFHEAGHIAVIRILNQPIGRMTISLRGIQISTRFDSPRKELLCALAGPACSLLGVLLMKWFPRFSICCLFHGIYNLLPIGQHDGARILCSTLSLVFGKEKAETYSCIVQRIIAAIILAVGVLGCFAARMGCWPLLFSIFILTRVQRRKIPCKGLQQRVQ